MYFLSFILSIYVLKIKCKLNKAETLYFVWFIYNSLAIITFIWNAWYHVAQSKGLMWILPEKSRSQSWRSGATPHQRMMVLVTPALWLSPKKIDLQEDQTAFVLVRFSAWASLEKYVNKRESGPPVNLFFLGLAVLCIWIHQQNVYFKEDPIQLLVTVVFKILPFNEACWVTISSIPNFSYLHPAVTMCVFQDVRVVTSIITPPYNMCQCEGCEAIS